MDIANTPSNVAFAASVNHRINADTRIVAARAAMWRCAGIGAIILAIGAAGTGIMWGYSLLHPPMTSDTLTEAFAEALRNNTLHTSGEVTLAPGQIITLDTSHADPLRLDITHAGKLQIELPKGLAVGQLGGTGNPVLPEPAPPLQQIPGPLVTADMDPSLGRLMDAERKDPGQPMSHSRVTTNFTQFSITQYGSGVVVTGWQFQSNEQAPYNQYCYFDQHETGDGTARHVIVFANNGTLITHLQPSSINYGDAIKNCVWFNPKRDNT